MLAKTYKLAQELQSTAQGREALNNREQADFVQKDVETKESQQSESEKMEGNCLNKRRKK